MHLLGLQPEPLDAAAQELGGLASVADVTDEEAVERAIADGVRVRIVHSEQQYPREKEGVVAFQAQPTLLIAGST